MLQKLNSIAHSVEHWGAANLNAKELKTIAKRFAELASQKED